MFNKRIKLWSLLLVLALLLTGCNVVLEEPPAQWVIENTLEGDNEGSENFSDDDVPQGLLKVHFIDVGQADAILIEAPTGKKMLVDAGNNDDEKELLSYLRRQEVQELEAVVGTHPHEDHIGSLDAVINNFPVKKVYLPKVVHTTKTFENLLLAVKNNNLKITYAKGGMTISLDPQLKVEILAPNSDEYEELNDYSIVLKITYGNTSFLLTGDAEKISEEEMIERGYDLKADVLKVGHHGSNTSTSQQFLQRVQPQIAVISAGKDNSYGHPHKEVLVRLKKAGVKILRTDEQGHILCVSDGEKITIQENKKE